MKIQVFCWHCGKEYYTELTENVFAKDLFCSDECRIANLKEEIKLKEIRRLNKNG